MRHANPIENTGIIFNQKDEAFLGSCCIFRYPYIVLTADHVVRGRNAVEMVVALPGSRTGNTLFPVRDIISHPTADLAVVKIDPPNERDITWAANELFDDRAFGVDVVAYGYPVHWDKGTGKPMPRLFKGHVQRFVEHESHLGYKYIASEFNFNCPAGLSGSLVTNEKHKGRVYGVITENIRTSSEIESVLEIEEGGKEYKESFHNIIHYGLALWLPAYSEWIDSVVEPVPTEEINRRSNNQQKWRVEEAG